MELELGMETETGAVVEEARSDQDHGKEGVYRPSIPVDQRLRQQEEGMEQRG